MLRIADHLPGRCVKTRYFPDVIALTEDEDAGYTGTGQYVVATLDQAIVGLARIPDSTVSSALSADDVRLTAEPLAAGHPSAKLWLAKGSSYELMAWTSID